MVDLRIVISDPKTGKSIQREVKEENRRSFHGLRLGDKLRGELLDLTGYEFTLTGGSDDSGFPMRKDVQGSGRKVIFTTGGVGIRKKLGKGQKIKKTVSGNTVGVNTAQINLKIDKAGKEDIFPKKEEAVPQAPKEEQNLPSESKKEEKKEKPKKEEKKEHKEEKPAEKKEEHKEKPKKEHKKEEEAKK